MTCNVILPCLDARDRASCRKTPVADLQPISAALYSSYKCSAVLGGCKARKKGPTERIQISSLPKHSEPFATTVKTPDVPENNSVCIAGAK